MRLNMPLALLFWSLTIVLLTSLARAAPRPGSAIKPPAAAASGRLELKNVPGGVTVPIDHVDDGTLRLDFSAPTEIGDIIRFFAISFGKPTVIDRQVYGKIRLVAAAPLPRAEAYQRYLAALAAAGYVAEEQLGVTTVTAKADHNQFREGIWRDAVAAAQSSAKVFAPEARAPSIKMDYPELTEIGDIARDVAGWSNRRLILDRGFTGKLQIFAPQVMTKLQAYYTYICALTTLGLGEIDRGFAVELMPIASINFQKKIGRELRFPAPPAARDQRVSLNYPELTAIGDIVTSARAWLGHDLVFSDDMQMLVKIYAATPMPAREAYKVLVAALDELGYTSYIEDDVVHILSYRQAHDEGRDQL